MMYQTVLLLTMAGGSVGNPPPQVCQGPVVYEVAHQASVLDRLRAHFPRQPGCQGRFYSGGLFRRGQGHGPDASSPGCGGVVIGSSPPAPSGSAAPPSNLPASAAPAPPSVPQPAPAPAQPQKKVAADPRDRPALEAASRADRLQVAAPNRE